jgi:hypothetical protein
MDNHKSRLVALILVVLALQLAACAKAPAAAKPAKVEPAKVEKIDGSKVSRLILTQQASDRIAIKTATAREAEVAPKGVKVPPGAAVPRKVIPYAALVYDLHGDAWAYTSPSPLTFVRHPVKVDYIQGDLAILTDGPPVGATVVTVGAAELFGSEFGVGH